MAIVYEPTTGQPVFCSDGRVADFLRQGYRSVPPGDAPTLPPPEDPAESTDQDVVGIVRELTALTGALDINSASLKELVTLPGVGTAMGKQIQQGRPYATVEDLIAKVPDISWLSMTNLIRLDPISEEPSNAANDSTDQPAA